LFRAFSGDRRKGRPEDDRLTLLSMQKAQRCRPSNRGPYGRFLHRPASAVTATPAPVRDTIVAIATPPGRGGIGIVRVSGGNLQRFIVDIVDRRLEPRVATHATFRGGGGEPIDEGLAVLFAAPASYTGESVLELHGHGSPFALRALLARCVELGARLAQPGEFTKRAYLNGKLDLAQAESVADLIDAATSTAARAAARSLTGAFSREVDALVEEVTTLRMYTEATLDFPEEDLDFLRAADAAGRLDGLRERLASLLSRARNGVRLAQGLTVVLAGQPNVGKSSLMNRLVRDEAAIVTAVAGTTRDTVERQIEIGGIPLEVVDTAGLRDTDDVVERIGIERTWVAIRRADLVIVIVDARDATADDLAEASRIVEQLPPAAARIVVHNKADLAGTTPRVERREGSSHIWLSALTGEGVDLLEDEVLALAGAGNLGEDAFIARERHVVALRAAQEHLDAAHDQLTSEPPALELFAEELRHAQLSLSQITGEFTADDLLGVIFSRFCIGK
jgi:tRNA modification GTPase